MKKRPSSAGALLVFLAAVAWYGAVSFVPPALSRRGIIAAAILGNAQVAGAATPSWEGKYSDPRHVGCKREIVSNGARLTVTGTKGIPGPGCDAQSTEIKSWSLADAATVKSPESQDIVIDFSPKGGPKDLAAAWDGDGIKFADGNKWTKIG